MYKQCVLITDRLGFYIYNNFLLWLVAILHSVHFNFFFAPCLSLSFSFILSTFADFFFLRSICFRFLDFTAPLNVMLNQPIRFLFSLPNRVCSGVFFMPKLFKCSILFHIISVRTVMPDRWMHQLRRKKNWYWCLDVDIYCICLRFFFCCTESDEERQSTESEWK